MVIQRRFEFYKLRTDVTDETKREFVDVLRNVGDFIPVVKDSIVGVNQSGSEIDLVWEHSYGSAEIYQQYMIHEYHACILDRYLMYGSPERITDRLDNLTGLAGYRIKDRSYYVGEGVRRIVLFGIRNGIKTSKVTELENYLRGVPLEVPTMKLSIVGSNVMGNAWRQTPWTHIWEQTYDNMEGMQSYLAGGSPAAVFECAWGHGEDNKVEKSFDVFYELHKAKGVAT